MNNLQMSKRFALFAALFYPCFSILALNVNDSVLFELSQPEGLFGPGSPINQSIIPIDLHSESVGPSTRGQIVRVNQDVPLDVLQQAWESALAQCQDYSVTVGTTSFCQNVTISPSRSECITGEIGSRTVSVKCCANVLRDYPDCGILGTTTNSRTVNVNKTLPVAIGPYPTQPLPTDTDIGAIITYQAEVDVGLEVVFEQDAGSVELSYGTDILLSTNTDQALPGDIVRLTARHQPDASKTQMETRFPNMDLSFRYYYKVDADIDLQWAHMDADGTQNTGSQNILHYSTADDPTADAEGRLVGEIISIEVGVGGAEVAFMTDVPYAPEETKDRLWQFPLAFEWDITQPFTCPYVPILSGKLCGPEPPLSFDLFELGVRTPDVNTPVGVNHDAGVDGFMGAPIQALNNHLGDDGALISTSPSGWRPLVAGLLGDFADIQLSDLLVTDGTLSNDFARLDMDVDGVISLASGTPPFGLNVSIPTSGIDPATGLKPPTPPLTLEGNAIDLDFVNWFSIDEHLTFKPNLMIILELDKPVQWRLSAADSWQSATRIEWPLDKAGQDATLEFVMPVGGITISPRYSLKNNEYINQVKWFYTPGWQTTYLQAKVTGFIATFLTAATGFQPNIALYQSTFSPGPVHMGDSGSTHYTFDHFAEHNGSPFSIVELDSDADGMPDSLDVFPDDPRYQKDSDADGLPDKFESDNNLDPNNPDDASADSDADGLSNAEEFALGTDIARKPQLMVQSLPLADQLPQELLQNVVLLRFRLQADSTNVRLDTLTVTASGDGDDSVDVQAVILWHDRNADGLIDEGDERVGQGRYEDDDAQLQLIIPNGLNLPLGDAEFIVSYDFQVTGIGGN